MGLPTLNVAKFVHGTGSERAHFGLELTESLKKHGFVKLVGHGFSDETISQLFEYERNRRFFSLPAEAKAKAAHPPSRNMPQRGWSDVGVESTAHLRGSQARDCLDAKEHFDQGSSHDLLFPNRWPEETDLSGFQSFMEDFYDRLYEFCLQMLRALEMGLRISPGSLTNRCNPSASDLRMNHYPAVAANALKDGRMCRIWPHTDFGLLTALFQDMVGGLEIEDRELPNTFLPVSATSTSDMVLNVSDTLQRWTNDVLRSGVHRVTVPQSLSHTEPAMIPDRYSVAFFFKADRAQFVGALPEFVQSGTTPTYDDITALEFQRLRTQSMYAAD